MWLNDLWQKSLFSSVLSEFSSYSTCLILSHLLVTAGEDRFVKTWDLRRLFSPITAFKRCLTNEINWPLNAPGVMMAQDNVYTA